MVGFNNSPFDSVVDGSGVAELDGLMTDAALSTAFFALSIHGFSGGVRGVVYWLNADMDKSHFFGAQTPTSTRQAAMRRFALRTENVSFHTL